MNQYALLIYLHQDTSNTLQTRISYIENQKKKSVLLPGVSILIQDNVLLFEKTKGHGAVTELCRDLLDIKHPYLVVPVQLDESLLVGKQSKEVENILSMCLVPFCQT